MNTRMLWQDVDEDHQVLEPEGERWSLWSFAVTVAIVTLGCWGLWQMPW